MKASRIDLAHSQVAATCHHPLDWSLKASIKQGETPWFFLLDQLSSWLADLAKNRPEQAKSIGHDGPDLIQHKSQNSLSGFTGPKFGLELLLNLETDQYMPTSRESGAKIIVHDSGTRADPDQDSVHVAPGLVTYIGVKMVNITRLEKPYPDKCSNEWNDKELESWARSLHYDTYFTQICLKTLPAAVHHRLLQLLVALVAAAADDVPQCNLRKKIADEKCSESIRRCTTMRRSLQLPASLHGTFLREVRLHRPGVAAVLHSHRHRRRNRRWCLQSGLDECEGGGRAKQSHMVPKKAAEEAEEKVDAEYKVDKTSPGGGLLPVAQLPGDYAVSKVYVVSSAARVVGSSDDDDGDDKERNRRSTDSLAHLTDAAISTLKKSSPSIDSLRVAVAVIGASNGKARGRKVHSNFINF
ncbi:hypothetical protein TYRP_000004 [Tyrophagus putrescentiae]|nr:hypothetical protein TYRP_000004 [Tyrophagus putrescentiae]